jgi:hypothetical protein
LLSQSTGEPWRAFVASQKALIGNLAHERFQPSTQERPATGVPSLVAKSHVLRARLKVGPIMCPASSITCGRDHCPPRHQEGPTIDPRQWCKAAWPFCSQRLVGVSWSERGRASHCQASAQTRRGRISRISSPDVDRFLFARDGGRSSSCLIFPNTCCKLLHETWAEFLTDLGCASLQFAPHKLGVVAPSKRMC